MAWELNNRGKLRYVHKERIRGRVVSKVFGQGPASRLALQVILEERCRARQLRDSEVELEMRLDMLEQVLDQIIDQHLTCNGYVRRQCSWQRVNRLNKPLTPEEMEYIKFIKSKCTPCPLSRSPISDP